MALTVEALLTAKDNMSPTFKKVEMTLDQFNAALKKTSDGIEKTGARTEKAVSGLAKIDSAGRNARIGLSSAAQAADLLGANLSGVVGPAASAADAIGDIAGSVAALGPVGLAIGALVVALGAAGVYLQGVHKSMVEGIKTNDAYLVSLRRIAMEAPAIAEGINRVAEAQAKLEAAHRGPGGDRSFASLKAAEAYEREREALEKIAAPLQRLNAFLADYEELSIKAEHATSVMTIRLNEQTLAMEYAAAAANRLIAEMGDSRGDAIKDFREGARSIAEMNTKAFFAKNEFKEGVGWVQKIPKASAEATAAIRKLEAAAAAMRARFQSVVEGALNPTAVTDDDMLAAKEGTYVTKWDEFRRRLEAVAGGTDAAEFGDDFIKKFEALGMSASAAAAAFKDFSLFANPENIKLADMGAIVADVEHQLQSMAGKANLTKAAMDEVWKNLSPQSKAALAEQGIDTATEAIGELVNPAGAAQEKVAALGSSLAAIPQAITTTFTVVKDAATTAVNEFRSVLDAFIADYGNVTVSIHADASAGGDGSGGDGGGSANNGADGARASGGYVGNGLYRLGENGKEYVLPHNMVKYIEGILGGPIRDPDEIGWLVGALGRGKDEALNQMHLWEGGRTGTSSNLDSGAAGKWIDKSIGRFAKDYGFGALSDVNQQALGGTGGAGGVGGGADMTETNGILRDIDRKLGAMLGMSGSQGNVMARGIQMRVAQGLG
jgi:hypothetical protein